MMLDEWFTATGTKEDAFAVEIGATQASVNRYRHRKREPRLKHAIRIVEATGVAVTLPELIIDQA